MAKPDFNDLDALPRTQASDVKKLGWRGVMRSVADSGKLVVTKHDEPQAVILSIAEYRSMLAAVQQTASRHESALDVLRQQFDERLASLHTPDAGDRLRALIRKPPLLAGKVKAGASY